MLSHLPRTAQGRPKHAAIPELERCEPRELLSTLAQSAANSQSAVVAYDYRKYVGDLRDIELNSQATPDDARALRDDARAISNAATPTIVGPKAATAYSVAASLEIDRSLLDGSLNDPGWNVVQGRITRNLQALGISQSRIDTTFRDMRTAASHAGVTSDHFATFTTDFNRLQAAEDRLNSYGSPSSSYTYRYPTPGLYYSQHVRGFFRGWTVQKIADETTLSADLRDLQSRPQVTPDSHATLRQDASLLQSLASKAQSDLSDKFFDDFAAAFDSGPPDANAQAQLGLKLQADLNGSLNMVRTRQLAGLVADASTFYNAVGSTSAGVHRVVDEVRNVVNDGGGSSLNPFKITVGPAPGG